MSPTTTKIAVPSNRILMIPFIKSEITSVSSARIAAAKSKCFLNPYQSRYKLPTMANPYLPTPSCISGTQIILSTASYLNTLTVKGHLSRSGLSRSQLVKTLWGKIVYPFALSSADGLGENFDVTETFVFILLNQSQRILS